jgi:hypothetical protein
LGNDVFEKKFGRNLQYLVDHRRAPCHQRDALARPRAALGKPRPPESAADAEARELNEARSVPRQNPEHTRFEHKTGECLATFQQNFMPTQGAQLAVASKLLQDIVVDVGELLEGPQEIEDLVEHPPYWGNALSFRGK